MGERQAVARLREHLQAGVGQRSLELGHDLHGDEGTRVGVQDQHRAGHAAEIGAQVHAGKHLRNAEDRAGVGARLLRAVPALHRSGERTVVEAPAHHVGGPAGHPFLFDDPLPRREIPDRAATVRTVRHRDREHPIAKSGRGRERDRAAGRLPDEVEAPGIPGIRGIRDSQHVVDHRFERPLEPRRHRARPVAAHVETHEPVSADERRRPAVPARGAGTESVVEEYRRRGRFPRGGPVDHIERDRAPGALDLSRVSRHSHPSVPGCGPRARPYSPHGGAGRRRAYGIGRGMFRRDGQERRGRLAPEARTPSHPVSARAD